MTVDSTVAVACVVVVVVTDSVTTGVAAVRTKDDGLGVLVLTGVAAVSVVYEVLATSVIVE